jgi:hypothetical protein
VDKEDKEFILSIVPMWAKDVVVGLDATMYGTGTYDGDLKVHERLMNIISK